MTKKELVELINTYPGPVVTTRARKATLMEILEQRREDAKMAKVKPTFFERICKWLRK